MESIDELKKEAIQAINKAPNPGALQHLKKEYLGPKGKISVLFQALKNVPPEKRGSFGKKVNTLRKLFLRNLDKKRQSLLSENSSTEGWFDITAPGKQVPKGSLHPITLVIRDVLSIFSSLGFSVVLGPAIENEWYNFDALNIPKDHPARDMWDTFWLKPTTNNQQPTTNKLLLRTHTSPVQIRYMEKHQPPFRIVVPGKIFRHEATDASHDIEFHQLEGLMVDSNVTVANFKDIILTFFKKIFKNDIEIRLRPSFYPFVEPGFDIDVSCVPCRGRGCSVCGRDGWLELAGAGMVHPNVFKNAGLNPKNWQGFAFGFGLDRLAMMRYKIPDIRLFHSDDPRFLKQF